MFINVLESAATLVFVKNVATTSGTTARGAMRTTVMIVLARRITPSMMFLL